MTMDATEKTEAKLRKLRKIKQQLSKNPAELEKQFFASGEGTTDFTEHVQLFSKTKEAYNWQTGQTPEMATATDLGNKTSGGDLRKKMAEALLQQKAYMSSKFESFQTQEKAGNLVQKV